MPEDTKKIFPDGFLWGASISAHQVEGGNHNQWTVWELENANELAKTASKRLSWIPAWEDIKKDAQKPENYISGRGVDHYHKYKDDFDLLKKLNLNAFRFSIEWSRLEPEEGQWDQEAIEHYRQYIKELRDKNIQPILNLWHWTLPVWFAQKGGFKKKANLKYFDRYVQKISDEYGSHLSYVITINEPNNYASLSYFSPDPSSGSLWPPAEKGLINLLKVYWHLVLVHRRSYRILKNSHPHLKVGVAAQLANIQAKRPHNLIDEFATKIMRYGWNWWFVRRIRREQDFLGINYYFSDYYQGLFKRKNPKLPLNDMGWYMEPEGLYPLILRAWARYKKPIIITETGVADQKDEYRKWWLEESIVAIEKAMSEGVEVVGYFYWSLLDNFEWSVGWWPKFGLIEVDRVHGMKRTIRPSAKWFAARIAKL